MTAPKRRQKKRGNQTSLHLLSKLLRGCALMAVPLAAARKGTVPGELSVGGTYKERVEGINVGIVDQNPSTKLTAKQLDQLQGAILRHTLRKKEKGAGIRFLSCTHKPGWLMIRCTDEASVSWLGNCLLQIKPWDGANLHIVRGTELPKPQCMRNIHP
ncbi:uncharacterized protein LOC123322783 [Coccinella septempunctata]|uniref:uncharacterized protein LOC123322783 n=1 Tax=Coccinella septempunctata TaxID=41139 RepID=UPI001D083C40|nr:uncharacterized protein LOC123322783 [Coccinella septempunctata]